jgi:hypothetical protein
MEGRLCLAGVAMAGCACEQAMQALLSDVGLSNQPPNVLHNS